MMRKSIFIETEIPDKVSAEIEFLKAAALPSAAVAGHSWIIAATHNVSILEKSNPSVSREGASPGADHLSRKIDQICCVRPQGRKEGVRRTGTVTRKAQTPDGC
jgi:hypothetical protein